VLDGGGAGFHRRLLSLLEALLLQSQCLGVGVGEAAGGPAEAEVVVGEGSVQLAAIKGGMELIQQRGQLALDRLLGRLELGNAIEQGVEIKGLRLLRGLRGRGAGLENGAGDHETRRANNGTRCALAFEPP
jgi:hypothetical protein